ncbi:MAG: YggS family pyridoxal phosphate-dependent enzyme [Bacteroidota bacterium]
MSADVPTLTADIRARAEAVRARIDAACERAGRDPGAVRLIAVSKTFPIEVVRAGIEAGLTDFGENRVQELEEKAGVVPGETGGGSVRWHLIGPLQKNKINKALPHADAFHALDSEKLAADIDQRAVRAGRALDCFVQVNVSGESSKSGLDPDALHGFLDGLAAYAHLRVVGLMTLASPAQSPGELETLVRPQFRHLRRLAETYGGRSPNVALDRLSMGMSGDFEVAVEEGATEVRVGSAIFGARE